MKFEFGGKEREFHFGLGFIDLALSEEKASDVLQISTLRLMYYSMRFAIERKGENPDFSLYDVYDWADEASNLGDLTKSFQVEFLKSMATRLENEGDKKKVMEAISKMEKKKPSTLTKK